MNINRNTFKKLRRHCTVELLSQLQEVNIDERNSGEDTWEVAPYLNNPSEAVNMMKIAFVFERIGRTLLFNGEPSQYVIIVHGLSCIFDNILLFWIHCEANGVLPMYDTADVIVPPILPRRDLGH